MACTTLAYRYVKLARNNIEWSQAALLGRPVIPSMSVWPCLPYSPISSQRPVQYALSQT